jgi:hypothetical protein
MYRLGRDYSAVAPETCTNSDAVPKQSVRDGYTLLATAVSPPFFKVHVRVAPERLCPLGQLPCQIHKLRVWRKSSFAAEDQQRPLWVIVRAHPLFG